MMRFIHEACQQTCFAKLCSTMFYLFYAKCQNNLLLLQIFKQISHEKDCSECQLLLGCKNGYECDTDFTRL